MRLGVRTNATATQSCMQVHATFVYVLEKGGGEAVRRLLQKRSVEKVKQTKQQGQESPRLVILPVIKFHEFPI